MVDQMSYADEVLAKIRADIEKPSPTKPKHTIQSLTYLANNGKKYKTTTNTKSPTWAGSLQRAEDNANC